MGETLYERIKRLRIENGLSQTELAQLVGYKDKTGIAKVEAGNVDLPQSKIVALAKVFGLKPGELIDMEEALTKENAILLADLLTDSNMLQHIKNLSSLDEEQRNYIYNLTELLLSKNK